jgi:hypothetical protein
MRDSFEPTNGKVYIKDIVSDATMNNWSESWTYLLAPLSVVLQKSEVYRQGSLMQHLAQ